LTSARDCGYTVIHTAYATCDVGQVTSVWL